MSKTLNSKIILAHNIHLDRDHKNVLNYNETQMVTLVTNNAIASASNYSFIRSQKKTLLVEFPYATCLQANYMAFQNPDYSNKWFFAFIDEVNYKSEATTEIIYTIDSWATFFSDITLKTSFVIREHVNDDTVGLHTVPENVETGDYVDQYVDITEKTNLNFLNEDGHSPYVVLAVSETGLNVVLPSGSRIYNNVYSGLILLTFPTTYDVDAYIHYIQHHITEDVIYSAFMCPYTIATDGPGFEWLTFTEGSTSFQYAFISYTTSATQMGLVEIKKPTNLDTYVPRNKKLLTFPYRYFNITNNSGSSYTYKYEYFNSKNGKDVCEFNMLGAISPGCSIRLIPYNYKKGKTYFDYTYQEVEESMVAGKLPTCGWTNDSYTNWLTQNAVNLPIGIATDIAKTAVGIGAGVPTLALNGATSINNTMMEIYQRSLVPTTSKGGVNQGDLNIASDLSFSVYKKCIKYEYAKIIDDYFSRKGYKVNALKVPNITGRQYWNYIQISNDDDLGFGNIPNNFMEEINNIARTGVTIWHDHANIGDFSLNNVIVTQ